MTWKNITFLFFLPSKSNIRKPGKGLILHPSNNEHSKWNFAKRVVGSQRVFSAASFRVSCISWPVLLGKDDSKKAICSDRAQIASWGRGQKGRRTKTQSRHASVFYRDCRTHDFVGFGLFWCIGHCWAGHWRNPWRTSIGKVDWR